jgi:TolB-like protein
MGDAMTKTYSFGEFSIDIGGRELRVGEDPVAIEPKAYDLIVYLIDNRDRAISKEELQNVLWSDVVVAESSLTRCVMKARRAVRDDSATQAVIRTVFGHGYQFVADVSDPETREDSLSMPVVTARATNTPSIAVLPFSNLSSVPDHEYLSDGMTDDLNILLSAVPGLSVVARTSSLSYKDRPSNIRQVGKDLGVRYIVEGSVRKIGDRFRVNVHLIEADSGVNLWADMVDRPLNEIFDVQDSLTQGIAAALGNELYRAEFARARKADPQTLDAWGLIARAMAFYYSGFRKEPLLTSIDLSRQAVARAPSYARASSQLAINLAMLVGNHWSDSPETHKEEALAVGRRAMELDADDVWVVYQWGAVNAYLGLPQRAIGILERALQLNPNLVPALAQMSRALIGAGRAAEALEHIDQAFRLSPRDMNSFTLYLYRARAHLQLDNLEAAAEAARKSLEINGSWNFSWFIYAVICMAQGEKSEATEALSTARELQTSITRDQYDQRLEFTAGGAVKRTTYFQELLHQYWPSGE